MHVLPFAGRAAGSCPHLVGCHRFPAHLCWLVLSLPWEECHIPVKSVTEYKKALTRWKYEGSFKDILSFLSLLLGSPEYFLTVTDYFFAMSSSSFPPTILLHGGTEVIDVAGYKKLRVAYT